MLKSIFFRFFPSESQKEIKEVMAHFFFVEMRSDGTCIMYVSSASNETDQSDPKKKKRAKIQANNERRRDPVDLMIPVDRP